MAANIREGKYWTQYRRALRASNVDPGDFEQICRIYGLLHDLGHLPLSHLFELGFDDYVAKKFPNVSLESMCQRWFGGVNFAKLHEACGSALAHTLLKDIRVPGAIADQVLRLMSEKDVASSSPLRPIKLLIDSEVDADRIDCVARDGLLAGGEYGSFDIERLCSAVFVQPHEDGWRLGYSHKALSSLEGILLDRYRTHTWIHYHHRVVALKVAVAELIRWLLENGKIQKKDFPVKSAREMALRDDMWLIGQLRLIATGRRDETSVPAAKRAFLYRDKDAIRLLWKDRTSFREVEDDLKERGGLRRIDAGKLGRKYEEMISKDLGIKTAVFWPPFRALGRRAVPLVDEGGGKTVGELFSASTLVNSLTSLWETEPQFYCVLLGESPKEDRVLLEKWKERTAAYLRSSG